MVKNPLQKQTKNYKDTYQPEKKHRADVHINVDAEMAQIVREMKKDPTVDKAIRGYARAFLGLN